MLLQDVLEFHQWNATHVDLKKYFELMKEGLVNIKKHPQYPLFLLNYTPRTQYRQKWCKELVHARGLVVEQDGKILARPLPKFFNHYEISDLEKLRDEEYEVFEKFDGRNEIGIVDGLVRLSVGIETLEDLIADIKIALDKI